MKNIVSTNDPNVEIVFSKQLTKSDINHQLVLPSEVLHFLSVPDNAYEKHIMAYDKYELEWPFILAVRQTGDYPKPYLQGGDWKKFVEDHRLMGGEGIVFYRNKHENDKLQVRIVRKNENQVWIVDF